MNLRATRRELIRAYFTFDGRSLAVFRVGLASVLIVDLLRRVPWLRDFYSNAGLLPNHTVLWRPPLPRLFSVFFVASQPEEAAVGFALAFVCFFCLLVGWRTRLFHVLSFAMSTSLHNRILFAENWGAVALGALMLWTAFLPLGRRYSVDALLASLRAGRDEGPADIAARRLPPPDVRPATSLAVLAVLLQLAVIYYFNFEHKSGATWRDGTAVHYVLYQERIVTWLGVWTREHAPFAFTRALTLGTLVIEASAPALILTPIFWRYTRLLAVVLLAGLHGGIALMVNLGIFSAAMLAYYPLLVDGMVWDWLARRASAHDRSLIAFYDADCGICFRVVRVVARLDPFGRVTWAPNRETSRLPAGIDAALLEQTILVVDPATQRSWTRSDAFAHIFMALPGGRLWGWGLLVPGVRSVAGVAYDWFAARRARISGWVGLGACDVPSAAGAPPVKSEPAGPAPARLFLRRALGVLRELGVAAALFVLGADLLVSNAGVPAALRWQGRPQWMAQAIMYPHIFESWGLFSPDAPLGDEMLVVDAITTDGRHVDPYNEVGSRVHSLPVDDIPVRLGHDSMFCDYTLRIPGEGAYHGALQDWILRYPERTRRPEDAIVSFEVTKLEHASPAPGQARPHGVRRHVIIKWPASPPR
ncbi:MAG TPA: DCC1-like thiol-disulfide oxidoreductase family protein [Polyangiaceae bacterium]|jgi:predicted DCC family thiol-disulfide oxidoreductase YuxK|nr:DCC1-like thiol-disulfide oxidoreductase family protein [Polyangiaceae bacterium]